MSGSANSTNSGEDGASLRQELRARWIAGDKVHVESLLAARPEVVADNDLKLDLVYQEFCLREDFGETPPFAEYQHRFPELAVALRKVMEVHHWLTESPTPAPPATASDRYELLETVGRGPMGTVYKARDLELDRVVAVKILRRRPSAGDDEEGPCVREARQVAQLRHAGIVPLYDVYSIAESPALVSEFVESETLASAMVSEEFSFDESADMIAQVAEALHCAHLLGILHLNLKPVNLVLERKRNSGEVTANKRPANSGLRTVRVMDFSLGLKRELQIVKSNGGHVVGTPAYLSPEQIRGSSSNVDARSDVYSLGIILYQLVTGELPFRGRVRMVIQQVLGEAPVRPRKLQDQLPPELEAIIGKCIEKKPARRYASAQDLAADLRAFQQGRSIVARPGGTVAVWWRWCKRHSGFAATVLRLIRGYTSKWNVWRK